MYPTDILEYFESHSSDITCSETFLLFSISLKLTSFSWSHVENCIDGLRYISQRDRFSLYYDICGTSQEISSCDEGSVELLKDLHDQFLDDDHDDVNIDIKIYKNINNNNLSIYSVETFFEFIKTSPLTRNLKNLSDFFGEFLAFEVFNDIQRFGSNTITFYPTSEEYVFNADVNPQREIYLSKINDHANVHGGDFQFIPTDFYLIERGVLEELNEWFDSLCSMFSIFSIANNASYCDSEKVRFKIDGYRSVFTKEKPFLELGAFVQYTYQIFEWIYGNGECGDKLGLVRNVLTLHLDENRDISFDEKTINAIRSNYQIYLQSNVDSYMEVKNKITEFVLESSSKVHNLCDIFIENFRNSIIAFVTFLLTVVLVNGIQTGDIEKIFSNAVIYIVGILSLVSIVWLILSCFDVWRRFGHYCNSTLNTLRINYHCILVDEEIEEVTVGQFSSNRDYLKKQLIVYSLSWAGITILFFLMFFLGGKYYKFNNSITTITSTEKLVEGPVSTQKTSNSNNILNQTATVPNKKIQTDKKASPVSPSPTAHIKSVPLQEE